MELPANLDTGFLDSLPEEMRMLILVGGGLLAIALVLKLVGAAIKAILSIVIFGALAALFVFVTHDQGWINWPFYDGETINAPDLPNLDDLPTREELEDLADKLPDPPK